MSDHIQKVEKVPDIPPSLQSSTSSHMWEAADSVAAVMVMAVRAVVTERLEAAVATQQY